MLAKLSGVSAIYVEVLESAQSVRYIAQVGDLRPLYASAAGKALLGAAPLPDRDRLLQGIALVERNPQTIVTREALDLDLQRSNERGWFMTRGEFLPDVTAVAVPVELNHDPYAVVIAGPSARMVAHLDAHVTLLKEFVGRAASSSIASG